MIDLAATLDKALQHKDLPLAVSCSTEHLIQLLKQCNGILQVFADYMQAPARMQGDLYQPDAIYFRTLKDSEGFMLPTFHKEIC